MDMNVSDTDSDRPPEGGIAVIGMAAHLPGSPDIERFWGNLRAGTECVTRFSDEELEAEGVDPALLRNPHYVKANAVLDRMEWFDAGFFGLSPRDAAVMDPQTRHFLECVWHALEHAGHVPERFDGNIGVFAGAGAPTYFWRNVMRDPDLVRTVGYFLLRHTGNDKDFVATRASYEFDLTGPSISVQTACSTSLVGIHMACQSLLSWECDMALAGGVTIEQPHRQGYLYEEGEILAPDGHCRSFDHRAQGTVFGSGAGIVVLRRLEDAIEAGDSIHAVIRGSAVNNDGAGKVSYLAPSVDGQAKAIAEALAVSGVDADSIGFVEAHGTATPVGDPIEVAALTQAFRTQTDRTGFCALGSVKSNIGHLDTAAGVASFIKAVLALEHGEVPPTVHFEEPNPLLELDRSPFFVNSDLRPWPDTSGPRRAGVSSLGVGGTNAHVIVEQAPSATPSGPARAQQLLVLSARSREALEDASHALMDHLDAGMKVPLADISFTLRTGRRRFEHRRALVCADASEAVQALATHDGLVDVETEAERRDVAFLLAGGGSQYPNMGRELYEREEVFRQSVDRCLAHLEKSDGPGLRSLLFCDPGEEEAAARELQRPSRALPALFAIQYAQARLWMSWGISPTAMLGHSMGEYTAACLAGVFTPEAGMSLVALRGRLFETVDRGGMLSVALPEEEIEPYLGERLSLAALNAPEVSVVAGPDEAIAELQERLGAEGHDCRRIRIDVAAHSSMLEPILEEFGDYLRTVEFNPPEIPVISNVTGERATDEQLTDPDYWVRHLRHTVRFADGVGQLLGEDGPLLLEVGAGRTLSTLSRMHPAWSKAQPTLHSLPHPDERCDAQAFQLRALGALWAHGVDADWSAFDSVGERRRVPLPGYPFQRAPHFVAPPDTDTAGDVADRSGVDVSGQRLVDPTEWFQQVAWEPTPLPPDTGEQDGVALLFGDPGSPADAVEEELVRTGWTVHRAVRGEAFGRRNDGTGFDLRPDVRGDWVELFRALHDESALPGLIVHASTLRGPGGALAEDASPLLSSLFLLQAIEEVASDHPVRFVALSSGALGVPGDPSPDPWAALLQGPVRVAPRELPSVRTRLVDAGVVPDEPAPRRRLASRLVIEATTADDDVAVAYRDGQRLVQRFRPVPLAEADPGSGLVEGGTYLVTGGLGGLGLVVARELAEQARARLVLVGRTGLPQPAERDAWLRDHPADDKTSRAIREVRGLERLGSEVMVCAADVADSDQLGRVVEEACSRFGRIDGVVHAAGVLDDGPLLARTTEQVETVLAPKTAGTAALERALEGRNPGLLILFSSVSAVIGAPGQIDYTAANAFMDVFARSRADRLADRVVSLGWGAWRDVGMAAELAGEARYGEVDDSGTALDHPLFDRELRSEGAVNFRGRWSRDRHWLLAEHRVRDDGWVLPGSGYVELLRHAWDHVAPDASFALTDLVFMRPFRVDETEERELDVELIGPADSSDRKVTVRSRGEAGTWIEHATATIGAGPFDARVKPDHTDEDLDTILGRLGEPRATEQREHPFMDFGPRWINIVARSSGPGEALLRHELSDAHASDIETSLLHPALLDMATAGAQDLVPELDAQKDFLVPAGYGALHADHRLGSSLISHIRLTTSDEAGGFASFDVTIFDPSGRRLAEIRGFDMVRVRSEDLGRDTSDDRPGWLAAAISPEEGLDVLRRVLAHDTAPHVLAATRPLDVLIEEASRSVVTTRTSRSPRRAPTRDLLPDVGETLERHDAVADAAVIGDAEGVADAVGRIVAFIVYEPGKQATVSELRRFVRKQLDRASTPQNFVEMVALPRDATGDVDLSELRDPFALEDDFIAPRTPSEETVASIWSELLGLDRVGIHDNFLDVGGHSLVGIRVLVRIERETGVRLEANDLTLQTLEQLAAEVDRRSGGSDGGTDSPAPASA